MASNCFLTMSKTQGFRFYHSSSEFSQNQTLRLLEDGVEHASACLTMEQKAGVHTAVAWTLATLQTWYVETLVPK